MSQLANFCDDTILLVRNILVYRLAREAFATANCFEFERSSIEHTIADINKRLRYMLQIRRVEMAYKLRMKTITT